MTITISKSSHYFECGNWRYIFILLAGAKIILEGIKEHPLSLIVRGETSFRFASSCTVYIFWVGEQSSDPPLISYLLISRRILAENVSEIPNIGDQSGEANKIATTRTIYDEIKCQKKCIVQSGVFRDGFLSLDVLHATLIGERGRVQWTIRSRLY